jgi:hypothetical protein
MILYDADEFPAQMSVTHSIFYMIIPEVWFSKVMNCACANGNIKYSTQYIMRSFYSNHSGGVECNS